MWQPHLPAVLKQKSRPPSRRASADFFRTRPQSSRPMDSPRRRSRSMGCPSRPRFPPVPPAADTTPPPSHARPVRPTIPRCAGDSPASAPGSRSDAAPARSLLCALAAANLRARSHRFQWPASCSNAPAAARIELFAPTWDSHSAPVFCTSGWLASHPPPQSAVQIARPEVAPRARPGSPRGTNRPRVAAHCRCRDRP